MRPAKVLGIIAAVVLVIVALFFLVFRPLLPHRADDAASTQTTWKPTPTESLVDVEITPLPEPSSTTTPVVPEVTSDSTPTDEPEPTSVATPKVKQTPASKLREREMLFGGKLSIQVPKSWCKAKSNRDIEVVWGVTPACRNPYGGRSTIRILDLTRTPSSDAFWEWKTTTCGAGLTNPNQDGPTSVTIAGEPAEFYRYTCKGTKHFHYAWLISSRDKLVKLEDATKPEIVQGVLETIRW